MRSTRAMMRNLPGHVVRPAAGRGLSADGRAEDDARGRHGDQGRDEQPASVGGWLRVRRLLVARGERLAPAPAAAGQTP